MSTQNDLTLGNESIDGEHRVQVQIVDAVAQALAKGSAGAEQVTELLGQLADFSNAHFGSEELLMRFHSYPHYHAHVEEHRRLLELLSAVRDAKVTDDAARIRQLVEEIKKWLGSHIVGMDRHFAEFVSGATA